MITNNSNKKIIAREMVFCKSILSKTKGLMFSSGLEDKGLVFVFDREKRWSIHMFFVFFPIDVLWLDKDKKVVDLRENVRPFCTCVRPKKKAKYIVELPAGSIDSAKVKPGGKISF